MDFKKLAPWNWFKDEENERNSQTAVSCRTQNQPTAQLPGSVNLLHNDMNELFNRFLQGYGIIPQNMMGTELLKPTVDINASDKEYSISVEVPGIEEDDIKLEINGNTLCIRGEKRQVKEDRDKNYYRMERSYGAFQRLLSLPEDADQDKVVANFKNGVLTITMARRSLPDSGVKQIQIN
jgi:HSP20 family protein